MPCLVGDLSPLPVLGITGRPRAGLTNHLLSRLVAGPTDSCAFASARYAGWRPMRHLFRRSRQPAMPAAAAPLSAYSDLCWLQRPDRATEMVPVRLSISEGRLVLDATPVPEWAVADQPLSRLAQLDIRDAYVDLLFVESASSLVMTRLRFVTADKAAIAVEQLLRHYESETGAPFPPAWLQRHAGATG